MDFKGQALCEWYYQLIAILFAVIGFVVGCAYQDFSIAFQIWLAGVVVASLVCIPDWPIYNRNPLKWVKANKGKSE